MSAHCNIHAHGEDMCVRSTVVGLSGEGMHLLAVSAASLAAAACAAFTAWPLVHALCVLLSRLQARITGPVMNWFC